MTRRITNAELIVLARIAEYELFNQHCPSFAEVAYDMQDETALAKLSTRGLIEIDLAGSFCCLTDAGIEEYESAYRRETGHSCHAGFYDVA